MCRIWVPHTFNRLASSGYFIDILFPAAMQVNVAKENLSKAVSYHFEKKGIEVDYNSKNIRTLQEERMEDLGGDTLKYGSGIIILLLLFIPAVNIVSLSVANTNDRAEEIAIRKAFGAGRLSSFLPVVMENLLLVTTGTVIGVLLAKPVFNLIQQNLIGASFDNLSFITSINFEVIFAGVIPAMLVFSLLSGGLPAYIISRSAIAEVLKGGSR
jgi:ABC-type antimicrobial peptide transport system permease subunit